MYRVLLSATVETKAASIPLTPGAEINVLRGENAEAVFWLTAGLFDIFSVEKTPLPAAFLRAKIRWPGEVVYSVSGHDLQGKLCLCVDYVHNSTAGREHLIKCFHKQRFPDARVSGDLFDGQHIDKTLPMGESDLILAAFHRFVQKIPQQENGRPLFLCNFLERLDAAVELTPIFQALQATGRQVFILLSPTYPPQALPHDAAVHTL